jgi:hypothetical protein
VTIDAAQVRHGDGAESKIERNLGIIAHMFYFIFGGAFLGVALSMVGVQTGGYVSTVALLLGGAIVGLAIGNGKFLGFLLVAVVTPFVILGVVLAMRGLAGLATGGIYGPDNSTNEYFGIQGDLIAGVGWLLVGVPCRGFKFSLDREGEGSLRRTVTGSLAAAASVLVGAYVITLHFGGGPFSKVDLRTLIVGDIFTIILLPPIFRAIAEKCWERGLSGSLSLRPLGEKWLKAGEELDKDWMEYYLKKFSAERAAARASKPTRAAVDHLREHTSTQRMGEHEDLFEETATQTSVSSEVATTEAGGQSKNITSKVAHPKARARSSKGRAKRSRKRQHQRRAK